MKVEGKLQSSTKNPSPPPSFSLLPDEITENYLARIPRSYYPTLSTVCKSFRSILSSTELYAERSRLGNTEQCLYVCVCDPTYQKSRWFTLGVNPYKTLPNSSMITNKTTGNLLVPIRPYNIPTASTSAVVVGSEIYVIDGLVFSQLSSSVRILDCRSHTWRHAPSMNVSWLNPISLAYDGKIYVNGGCGHRALEVEVFDIKTQTWAHIPDLVTESSKFCSRMAEVEGTVYLETYCTAQARFNVYAYDVKQGKWECCDNKGVMFLNMSKCVMKNVYYRYDYKSSHGKYICMWYDINSGNWKEVKGLDSLRETHMRNDGSRCSTKSKLVSFGGKLLLIWEGDIKDGSSDMKNIWIAVIAMEKRVGGELWGNVEWVDVVHRGLCRLLNCLVVSV